MKSELLKLQTEIEIARADLDNELAKGKQIKDCYTKSVHLDQLIDKYIDLYERNKGDFVEPGEAC